MRNSSRHYWSIINQIAYHSFNTIAHVKPSSAGELLYNVREAPDRPRRASYSRTSLHCELRVAARPHAARRPIPRTVGR